MTTDNDQPLDHAAHAEPEQPPASQPAQPSPAPPASEPAPVVSLPLAAAPTSGWRSRGVVAVAGAVAAAALLFGSGFAVGHATGGGDHDGRRPTAMRNAGQRGQNDGTQQAPGGRLAPQGQNGQQPSQEGAPNRQQGQQRPNRQQQPDQQQTPQQQTGPSQRQ